MPVCAQVSPPPDDVYPNKDTTKVLDSAAKIMKERKDAYLAVDALILAVLGASDVGSALQEAGVLRGQLEDAVKEVRGEGWGTCVRLHARELACMPVCAYAACV